MDVPTAVTGRSMKPPWQADLPPRPGAAPSHRPEIIVLRVVTMLLVLVVHAAEPFNPWDAWHVQSPERSKWFGELVLLLAPWVMPLFVLLAGVSAWHSLGKRSAAEYLHERVTRLVVPLAAGILLLSPPQVYLDRRQRGLFDGSFVDFYPHFFDGVYPTGNFTLLHLWFLGVLALLALITLPLFRWLRGPTGRRALSRLAGICAPRGAILLLVLPMIAVRAALWSAFPHGHPIVTDWANRTVLLPLFIYGYMLAGEPELTRAVDRQWKLALVVALAFSAAMFAWAWPGDMTKRFPIPFSTTYVLFWSAYALGGWAWCVAAFGAVRAISPRRHRVLDRAQTLLNPFYMLHQTVLVVLAFYLVGTSAGPMATFGVLLIATLGATTALSVLVQRSRVTRVLFGVRAVGAMATSPARPRSPSRTDPRGPSQPRPRDP